MVGITLSPEQIASILKHEDEPRSTQTGRIRFYDKEMRCASRGCSSPTYIKLDGIEYCMMHIILKCNELLGDTND